MNMMHRDAYSVMHLSGYVRERSCYTSRLDLLNMDDSCTRVHVVRTRQHLYSTGSSLANDRRQTPLRSDTVTAAE
jgi:hypothetical protein